jgi:hypothetical protein
MNIDKNSTPNSNRVRYLTIATTVFITTVSILFFYYLRLSRPQDPRMREFTSICMGVAFIFGGLYLTAKLYLVSRHDKERDTVHSDYGKPTAWAQTEVKLVYQGFIGSWFCFLFLVHKMNPALRDVSAWVFVGVCIWVTCAILVGFVMRRRLFKLASEALPHDPRKASEFWRSANFTSFGCAMNVTICGVVLKILGSGWLVPGILFGLGLGFLLLWRPRQLAVSTNQTA